MPDFLSSTALCFVGAILVLGFIFLAQAIKIVPEYQRLVVFRLGRNVGPKGPGIVLLIPVIDRAVRVDLREQLREVPHQVSMRPGSDDGLARIARTSARAAVSSPASTSVSIRASVTTIAGVGAGTGRASSRSGGAFTSRRARSP